MTSKLLAAGLDTSVAKFMNKNGNKCSHGGSQPTRVAQAALVLLLLGDRLVCTTAWTMAGTPVGDGAAAFHASLATASAATALFCPHCGTMLVLPSSSVIVCSSCAFRCRYSGTRCCLCAWVAH